MPERPAWGRDQLGRSWQPPHQANHQPPTVTTVTGTTTIGNATLRKGQAQVSPYSGSITAPCPSQALRGPKCLVDHQVQVPKRRKVVVC